MNKLSRLRSQAVARVVAIHGENEIVSRLHAMGVLPGKLIKHANTAPLGDPVAYLVDGLKIGIRRAEAACVEIEEGSHD